jgi:hypothetical protein
VNDPRRRGHCRSSDRSMAWVCQVCQVCQTRVTAARHMDRRSGQGRAGEKAIETPALIGLAEPRPPPDNRRGVTHAVQDRRRASGGHDFGSPRSDATELRRRNRRRRHGGGRACASPRPVGQCGKLAARPPRRDRSHTRIGKPNFGNPLREPGATLYIQP